MLWVSKIIAWQLQNLTHLKSRVSCQRAQPAIAYAWQIGPFWQDTLEICHSEYVTAESIFSSNHINTSYHHIMWNLTAIRH